MLLQECAIGTVVCTVPEKGRYADKVGTIEKLTTCRDQTDPSELRHRPINARVKVLWSGLTSSIHHPSELHIFKDYNHIKNDD